MSTMNTANSQIYINLLREDSVFSLLNSYLEINFDVLHAATNNRYTDGNDIRLVNLGLIALFSNCKLTTSSGKHLEDTPIVSLTYKLLTSYKNSDDLFIGFDRDRNERQQELTNNKNIKGKFHVRVMLKDIFGFAEYQEKASYGLGYKLTLTRNSDYSVLNKDNATNFGKFKINSFEWCIPHYTPSIPQQATSSKQILSKLATELQYLERSVFMKEVNTQILWSFELRTQEGIKVPILIFIGLQQRDRQYSQNLNKDTFYRPPVTSGQCIIGTEKYPYSSILFTYDDDDYSLGYGEIKEAFRALTKDDFLDPYITGHDVRSSNEGNDIGYNLYVFDIRYQKKLESAQPIKVKFNFLAIVPAGIYGYALVLTNNLVSISSDGQRHFGLI